MLYSLLSNELYNFIRVILLVMARNLSDLVFSEKRGKQAMEWIIAHGVRMGA